MSGQISNFFNKKSVLITGSTGFMGKMIVHKLLTSCPGIDSVYLPVRPKKGLRPEERLKSDILFQDIVKDKSLYKKIKVMPGDLLEPNLGLSQLARNEIKANVSVVFHAAANVRFFDPLKKAVDTNLIGTKRVLNLANDLPKLESFIHISTAYVMLGHHLHDHLEERIYKNTKMTPDDLVQIASMRADLIDEKKIIEPFYGSYFMTKCMTEQMIEEEYAHLPLAILRPTLITASARYPSPGFVDNTMLYTGTIVLTAQGLLRGLHFAKKANLEMLPVDLATNATIVAAWHTATESGHNKEIKVYNLFNPNRINFDQFGKGLDQCIANFPLKSMLWKPSKYFSKFKLSDYFYQKMAPIIGSFGDFLSGTNKLSKVLKVATADAKAYEIGRYRNISGDTKNVESLRDRLLNTDQESIEKFDFDRTTMVWDKYAEDYYHGIRQYVLKEQSSDLPAARKKLKKMQVIHYGAQISLLVLFLTLIAKKYLLN